MSPDAQDELAELRRRAYGPDADIVADPAALARLRELETFAHDRARAAGAGRAASAVSDAVPDTGPGRSAGPASAAPSAADPVAARAEGGEVRRRLPRRLGLAWVASIVAAVVVSAGLTAWLFPLIAGDTTPHAARLTPQPGGDATRFVTGEDVEFRYFGTYLGLSVYAGNDCLQVIFGGEGSRAGTGSCTGGGLAATLDVTVPAAGGGSGYSSAVELPAELTDRYPQGATLRFTDLGDVVVVDVGALPAI